MFNSLKESLDAPDIIQEGLDDLREMVLDADEMPVHDEIQNKICDVPKKINDSIYEEVNALHEVGLSLDDIDDDCKRHDSANAILENESFFEI